MSNLRACISSLQKGNTISIRPAGNSMTGRIASKQLCTIVPVDDSVALHVNDIVLCKVHGNIYLHLISRILIKNNVTLYEISNNFKHVNGIISRSKIYGKCIAVE